MRENQIEDVYALSPMQAGILFHTLYTLETGVYLDQHLCVLQGDLTADAFERAWQAVIARHSVLRTSFHWEGLEEPLQVVHASAELPLQYHDWRSLSEGEQQARLDEFLKEDRTRGVELSRAPVMRLTLIRTGADTWQLVWTSHHLLMDRWSLPQIHKDLLAAYEAAYYGRATELPATRPYGDYIGWLQEQDPGRAAAYWRRSLAGFTAPTLLPMDRTPGGHQGGDLPAKQRVHLSEETTTALQSLARKHRLTLNTLLQGAWAMLLSRYSGEEDILFGVTVSGRPPTLPGVESMVGNFINSLPFRIQVSRKEMLLPWLQKLQDDLLEMRDYEYSSLVQVQGWSDVPQGTPLFESLVVVQNIDISQDTQQGGVLQLHTASGEFWRGSPLNFMATPDRQLRLTLSYDACRYDADDIVRMLRHLSVLLEALATDPDRSLASLPLLSEPERQQLLVEWNDTAAAYPHEQCFHQLFEAQVERTPDALAVVCGDQRLTYSQLNARANQLAHFLQKLEVGPEVRVGLCLDRSTEMVVGLLGVLKAGGAYVPLDPTYPLERLAFMIEDAQTPVLLTREACVDALPNSWAQVVCLDTQWGWMGAESETNPESGASGENVAYVIYTSGTTGRPKGVMVPHRGLVNYLAWCSAAYAVAEGRGSPVHSSIAFDLTITSMLPSLLSGRTVWMLPEAEGVEALSQALEAGEGFSLVKITPAHLELLSGTLTGAAVGECTRAFVIGGEALRAEQIEFWRRHAPKIRLINEYGPTETVVGCCVYECGREFSTGGGVPIGRPIANTRLYVLDGAFGVVPIGVAGELFIGGAGVGRGYLNDPELTAERFVPDLYSPGPGARLYKSGDVCRYLADGNIEYLGRLDHQVKVRGFRIELGEIEAVLLQQRSMSQAVVLAREDVAGDKRLVAYVVPQPESPLDVSDLRELLKGKLPEYMVPSAFVMLESLPLTPNGKVDRKALPAPDGGAASGDGEYVTPRTPVEEGLAEIWREVLRVDRVGVHDSFFALGGHSLLATQVISRIRNTFQVELPMQALFEAHTIAGLAARIGASGASERSAAPPLVRVSREGLLPLSFAQQRLWFIDQMEPDSSLYNIPMALRLSGALDVTALQQSLQEILLRHEAMRTTFALVEGEPYQVIHEGIVVTLPVLDLSSVEGDERETQARHLITEEAQRPFDLARGPLFRFGLLRLQDKEHVLLLTLHHIVSDGWSQGVLRRELRILYNALHAGRPSPLAELAIQYADYAAWQREWLQGEELQRQVSYWKERLGGAPALLELPADRPRPPVQKFHGARVRREFSAELTASLKALGQREGTTLFMTLLTAFQILLSRYSGHDDIVVGTPIANRTRAEVEGVIGFFVNTLALRTDLSGDPSFVELLGQVREVCLGGYAHQDLPFEKLVEELQPPRSLSYSPVFQVMFSLANAPGAELGLEGLEIERMGVEGVSAKFDLSLVLSESSGRLGGLFEYNTDLFDADRIARMLGHLESLLVGMVSDPQQKVSHLPLLTQPEREQLLVAWNDTVVEYAGERCVQELFEEQVVRTPDAIALVHEDQQLTYDELNTRANQLAHYLQSLGVGPEVLVGVCMNRSLDMVVALLGILKAGGAYVPLDPTYPLERLAFMLQDARATLLLSQLNLEQSLPHTDAKVIFMDNIGSLLDREATDNPASPSASDHLAYVIYTSGSTGKPKGAMITHRGLINYLCWCTREYRVEQGCGAPVYSSIGFDLTVTGLYSPLLVGRQVVLVSAESGPESLGEALLAGSDYSLVKITPAHLELLSHALPGSRTAGRTHAFIIGGEVLRGESLSHWREYAPQTRIVNEYGPTETVVGCCVYSITAGECVPGALPIGRPIANTQLYVLDSRRLPVPVGVPGELYIGGDGVGRGYLQRAELTAERFVPDPFGSTPGMRLYGTGDLVRYLADGNIEYLGRLDHQVKVRGFRIELGEIESVLLLHPGVRDTVVVAREDVPDDKRLVAYVASEAALSVSELREHLLEQLPEYMVPSAFVMLESLPLTPNGKVDRKALPAPDGGAASGDGEYVTPRTPVEEGLAEIWREVLRVDRVGVHDSFFALGGHSLLATQVISRIRNTFQVELPMRALFEAHTIAGLAARIGASGASERSAAPPLVRVSREGLLPLSFAQQRLWFIDQMEPDSSLYNIPMALRLSGALDVTALQQSLQEILLRHEAMRTTFALVEGEPYQVIHEGIVVTLPVLDLSSVEGDERETQARHLITEEAQRPFDLARGPLFRFGLLRLQDKEHVLLLTLHHIVSDGWSQGVLRRELRILYNALHAGRPSPLAELAIQYADYAAWQREWLQGEELQRQVSYWKERLGGAPALLELPADRPRPPVQKFHGARVRREFSAELTASLKALGQREGTTLFMTLLTAFQILLSRYSGHDDIVVGTPIANRTRAEVEGVIGFFVNTLALRTDLSGDPSFVELLGRVREVCLGGYAHQDLPFEKLVEELQPPRSLSYSPVFQVMFSLANAPGAELGLEGLEIERMGVEGVSAKFDLSLVLSESSGRLGGLFEYNTDLFDADRIARMLGHLESLLVGMVSDPQQKVSHLPLLTQPEREQLLVAWNDTVVEYAGERCVQELFEEQVVRTPDAIALVHEDQQLTYDELNTRANQLAHYLQSLGVGPEVLVGVCMNRSLDMVVALLGILKAGGAYVALDPTYPPQRIQYTLNDADATLLITQEALLDTLPQTRAQTLCLDREPLHTWPTHNPISSATPDSLAYVLYTSGSTGRPKGVAIEHHSPVALVNWALGQLTAEELSGVVCATSICFDLSVYELFVTLCGGGRVLLVENALAIAQLPAHAAPTLINTVPSAMTELLRMGAVPSSVRRVNLAGEPLSASLVEAIYEQTRVSAVYDLYGPSEDTTYSTCALRERGGRVSIGRPISNTRAYVLDGWGRPVPVGVTGELYLGGSGLARGYVKQPEWTACQFVADGFSAVGGARLYRTGDLVRYLPDGRLAFVGRLDHQVKVRGFRIELGEIESVLLSHSSVVDAVVMAREDVAGEKRLVAYVVSEAVASVGGLRTHLLEQLPEYMVPSAFVMLESLPLSPNGKVDRKALPAPDMSIIHTDADDDLYATPIEEIVAGIWANVLGLRTVSANQDFFELGGHSLLATRVMARLREAADVELPLRMLFDYPTVRGLAHEISSARTAQTLRRPPHIMALNRQEPTPLSFAQQRLWLVEHLEPGSYRYNIPSAIRLRGALNVEALRRAIEAVVHRYEVLRTTFSLVDGTPLQVISEPGPIDLPVIDLSNVVEQDREHAAVQRVNTEAKRPFNLTDGPVFRSMLVKLDEIDHIFLLTLHHIASDVRSLGILRRDLEVLYTAFACDLASPLPDVPLQYADFAAWQRSWLQGEVLEELIAFWRAQLDGAPAALQLPYDRPHPIVETYEGVIHPFTVDRELTAKIVALSRRSGLTLFMTLLAAYQILLYRYSGQNKITVGTDVANRNDSEVEQIFGCFVNQLVLCSDLAGDPTVLEFLTHVREVCLGAYAHQELPFDVLVASLAQVRESNITPIFQAKFVLLNHDSVPLSLPGLTSTPVRIPREGAKFDLTLTMMERNGELRGTLEYRTSVFDPDTIAKMAERFNVMLEAIVEDPNQRISNLPLLADQHLPSVSPSDFSAAGLTRQDLENIILQLGWEA